MFAGVVNGVKLVALRHIKLSLLVGCTTECRVYLILLKISLFIYYVLKVDIGRISKKQLGLLLLGLVFLNPSLLFFEFLLTFASHLLFFSLLLSLLLLLNHALLHLFLLNLRQLLLLLIKVLLALDLQLALPLNLFLFPTTLLLIESDLSV
jgi:hypothetical protein